MQHPSENGTALVLHKIHCRPHKPTNTCPHKPSCTAARLCKEGHILPSQVHGLKAHRGCSPRTPCLGEGMGWCRSPAVKGLQRQGGELELVYKSGRTWGPVCDLSKGPDLPSRMGIVGACREGPNQEGPYCRTKPPPQLRPLLHTHSLV